MTNEKIAIEPNSPYDFNHWWVLRVHWVCSYKSTSSLRNWCSRLGETIL